MIFVPFDIEKNQVFYWSNPVLLLNLSYALLILLQFFLLILTK
jgi:hypothetical protein